MSIERHHLIPLSLGGLNDKCNIVKLTHDDHKIVHTTMNYPYRVFTDMWRTFRRRHNGKGCYDIDLVEDLLRMQAGYMGRYYLLPEHLQEIHIRKLNHLVKFFDRRHHSQYTFSKLWYEYEEAFKNYYL